MLLSDSIRLTDPLSIRKLLLKLSKVNDSLATKLPIDSLKIHEIGGFGLAFKFLGPTDIAKFPKEVSHAPPLPSQLTNIFRPKIRTVEYALDGQKEV